MKHRKYPAPVPDISYGYPSRGAKIGPLWRYVWAVMYEDSFAWHRYSEFHQAESKLRLTPGAASRLVAGGVKAGLIEKIRDTEVVTSHDGIQHTALIVRFRPAEHLRRTEPIALTEWSAVSFKINGESRPRRQIFPIQEQAARKAEQEKANNVPYRGGRIVPPAFMTIPKN